MTRHALPALAAAVLCFQVLFADELRDSRGSAWTFALLCIAPGLMLLYLLRSEGVRLALPEWPRPLPADAWTPGG